MIGMNNYALFIPISLIQTNHPYNDLDCHRSFDTKKLTNHLHKINRNQQIRTISTEFFEFAIKSSGLNIILSGINQ